MKIKDVVVRIDNNEERCNKAINIFAKHGHTKLEQYLAGGYNERDAWDLIGIYNGEVFVGDYMEDFNKNQKEISFDDFVKEFGKDVISPNGDMITNFKVGDHVIGNNKADDRYSITCKGWTGRVVEVIDEHLITVQATGESDKSNFDGFEVNPKYFDLVEPQSHQQSESRIAHTWSYSLPEVKWYHEVLNDVIVYNQVFQYGKILGVAPSKTPLADMLEKYKSNL